MKKFWNYLNNSNIKIAFDLNPFVWSFVYMYQPPTNTDPFLKIWYTRILPLSIIISIDNGVYKRYNDEAENIEVKEEDNIL